MNYKTIRAAAFGLALLCLIGCFAGCSGGGSGTETEPPATQAPETEPEKRIVLNGDAPYTLMRPDKAGEALTGPFSGLGSWFRGDIGWKSFKMDTDFVRRDTPLPIRNDLKEILVGQTNRAESAEALTLLTSPVGYVVTVIGDKIVIAGTDDDQTADAIEVFKAAVTDADGVLSIPADLHVIYNFGTDGTVANLIATRYTIVTDGTERAAAAAQLIRDAVKEAVGTGPKIVPVSAKDPECPGEEYEILVGNTNRAASRTAAGDLTYQDYVVAYAGKQIVILGGSPYATLRAAGVFRSAFLRSELPEPGSSWRIGYSFAEHRADSVIYHLDTFRPAWMDSFTPADWMMDFNEKSKAIYSGGRFCSDAHRGDTDHYPENSAEGIRSAALMGADCIEIDIRLSKDNVPVLSHDASLKRATNYSQMAGKNGLPASDQISDWTYEQLLQLDLLFDKKASGYKICTLYEAVVAAGKYCFLHMDDKADCLDLNTDVYLLGKELDCKACFLYYYGFNKISGWVSLDPTDTAFKDYINTVRKYTATSGYSAAKRDFDLLDKYGDDAAGWLRTQKDGVRMLFTNNITDMQKYIKENFKPETN